MHNASGILVLFENFTSRLFWGKMETFTVEQITDFEKKECLKKYWTLWIVSKVRQSALRIKLKAAIEKLVCFCYQPSHQVYHTF